MKYITFPTYRLLYSTGRGRQYLEEV